MQRYLPLSRLGLELPDVIGCHPDETAEVALADDIVCKKAIGFPRAQPCQQAEQQDVVQFLVLSVDQQHYLNIFENPIRTDFRLGL